jgi:TPR repeat protein
VMALAKSFDEAAGGDPDVSMWLYSLAARQGDAAAMIESARLLEQSHGRVPSHMEHIFAWYALAAERLQAVAGAESWLAAANEGRARMDMSFKADQRGAAEMLLANLRTVVPVPNEQTTATHTLPPVPPPPYRRSRDER